MENELCAFFLIYDGNKESYLQHSYFSDMSNPPPLSILAVLRRRPLLRWPGSACKFQPPVPCRASRVRSTRTGCSARSCRPTIPLPAGLGGGSSFRRPEDGCPWLRHHSCGSCSSGPYRSLAPVQGWLPRSRRPPSA
ncbi:MAG: hypothetical protein ACLSUW_05425 [Akkermansia sp.]